MPEVETPCYVLDDRRRLITRSGFIQAIGRSWKGNGWTQLESFLGGDNVKSFVSKDLTDGLKNPIRFIPPGGGQAAYGYPAEMMVDLCDAILAADDAGTLKKQQQHIAKRCSRIIRAYAKLGIVAAVDEATGYQEIRPPDELQRLYEVFLSAEPHSWQKEYAKEFDKHLCRLSHLKPSRRGFTQHPLLARRIKDLIYTRMGPGIYQRLQEMNPRGQDGQRAAKHHQHVTPAASPLFRKLVEDATAYLKASNTYEGALTLMDKAHPRCEGEDAGRFIARRCVSAVEDMPLFRHLEN